MKYNSKQQHFDRSESEIEIKQNAFHIELNKEALYPLKTPLLDTTLDVELKKKRGKLWKIKFE